MNSAARFRSSTIGAVTAGALTLAVLSGLLLITVRSAGAQTETLLYNFCSQPNCTDGFNPEAGLTADGAGNFYGTTNQGGLGFGTVFELSPNGVGGYDETVLYAFTGGPDGGYPVFVYLLLDSAGNLYGTTAFGGASGSGVVFELSPAGGVWTETVLYSFDGSSGKPWNGLIMDSADNLYGFTTELNPGQSPDENPGSVYELSRNGNGGWTEQVLYSVDMGGWPGLVMDASGNIYGADYDQHIFELTPNGQGGWNATNIFTFKGANGLNPYGTPVIDRAGNLYGTTAAGGLGGNGTVWKLSPGNKGWEEKILHNFAAVREGITPVAGIVLDAHGNIYGTTVYGGTMSGEEGTGQGTVYELVAPVGEGAYKEKVLWRFNDTGKRIDGTHPYDSLILDSAGNLYGTAAGGADFGVVFELTP